MITLRNYWWKIAVTVITAIVTRILILLLIPARSSETFQLPPSVLSRSIGMIPTAVIVITACYAVIICVLFIMQERLPGSKLKRWALCAAPFCFMWLVAVLETVPSLGKPFFSELLIGLSDILPLLLIGGLVSILTPANVTPKNSPARITAGEGILVITFTFLAGRYFQYAVIQVNSGYRTHEAATFLWTFVMGVVIGTAYILLRPGLIGSTPLARGIWFGVVAFGLYWTLNNLFMPLLFDMSFIQFSPTIMNFVYRIIVDVAFVSFGVWICESSRM